MPVHKTQWKCLEIPVQTPHVLKNPAVHHGSCDVHHLPATDEKNPALQSAVGLLLMGKQSPQTGHDDLPKKIEQALLKSEDRTQKQHETI